MQAASTTSRHTVRVGVLNWSRIQPLILGHVGTSLGSISVLSSPTIEPSTATSGDNDSGSQSRCRLPALELRPRLLCGFRWFRPVCSCFRFPIASARVEVCVEARDSDLAVFPVSERPTVGLYLLASSRSSVQGDVRNARYRQSCSSGTR